MVLAAGLVPASLAVLFRRLGIFNNQLNFARLAGLLCPNDRAVSATSNDPKAFMGFGKDYCFGFDRSSLQFGQSPSPFGRYLFDVGQHYHRAQAHLHLIARLREVNQANICADWRSDLRGWSNT